MKQGCEKSLDFSVRLFELTKILRENDTESVLLENLFRCSINVGKFFLCLIDNDMKINKENVCYGQKAYENILEAEILINVMGRVGLISENQIKPIKNDCMTLKQMIVHCANEGTKKKSQVAPYFN